MEGDALNVWILDNDEPFIQKLQTVVAQSERILCDQVFLNNTELYEYLSKGDENEPDLLIISSHLNDFGRGESLSSIKEKLPGVSVLVVSKDEDINLLYGAFRNGAKGYIHEENLKAQVIKAIETVSKGGIYVSQTLADRLMRAFRITKPKGKYGLTNREKEILKGLAEGYSQKEMANNMFISPHTVNSHLQNIYKKLQVNTGIQAVAKALTEQII